MFETLLGAVAHAFNSADVIADTSDQNGLSKLVSVGLSRKRELVRMTVPDTEPALLTCFVWPSSILRSANRTQPIGYNRPSARKAFTGPLLCRDNFDFDADIDRKIGYFDCTSRRKRF